MPGHSSRLLGFTQMIYNIATLKRDAKTEIDERGHVRHVAVICVSFDSHVTGN